ncbi:YihY/virulence factor BrkB family protein [Corynebacterium mayonis]|uniref:YihY/virulence factor BrkB family protein n=1 Tax=Corynebacterium mayonis TaxID=3062461 RepID=UPI0031402801
MENPEVVAHRAEMVLPYGVGRVEVVAPPGVRPHPLTTPGNRLTRAGWVLVLKRLVADFSVDAMVDRAASLTYYTLLSLAPAMVATYSFLLLLLPADDREIPLLFAELVERYIPSQFQMQALAVADTIVGTPSENKVALIVSGLLSLLSASAYMRSFSRNANVIYGRVEGRNFLLTWLTMGLATVVLEAGALVIIVASLMRESLIVKVLGPVAEPLGVVEELEYMTSIFLPVWSWLQMPFIAVVSLGLVSMLFYVAPNVRRGRFRVFTVGALLSFLLSAVIWLGFGLYTSLVGVRSAYGAFGTVLTVLLLVWLMNVVLLVGVKVDAEVLRAKELQLGYGSDVLIQAPPKSMEAVKFRIQVQRWLDKTAARVKGQPGG